MERLIDPVIADLQSECAVALGRNQKWRSRWTRVVGSLAFWKVIGLYSIGRAAPLVNEWGAADDGALRRAWRFSAGWTVAATAWLVWLPLNHIPQPAPPSWEAQLIADLIPQAIALAIPLAMAIGTLCGLRGRCASTRTERLLVATAALLSVAMFINVGWILPDANQAFRVLAADRLVAQGVHLPVPRGVNELTFLQLAMRGYWFDFHARWALSVATLVLVQFTSAVSRRMRGSWPSIAVGLVAVVVYLWSLQALQRSHPSPIEAWAPNLIFILLTVLLVQVAPSPRHQTSPHS